MRALLITVFGGLAMLAGFILIYITLGTFELYRGVVEGVGASRIGLC